jgi:hypothetical protein
VSGRHRFAVLAATLTLGLVGLGVAASPPAAPVQPVRPWLAPTAPAPSPPPGGWCGDRCRNGVVLRGGPGGDGPPRTLVLPTPTASRAPDAHRSTSASSAHPVR